MTRRTDTRPPERRTKRGRIQADLALIAETAAILGRLDDAITDRYETARRVKTILLVAQYHLSQVFKDVAANGKCPVETRN